MRRNRYVETFATIVARTPDSCFSVIDVLLIQLCVASGANELIAFLEMFLGVNVAAWNVFNK
jgi:hypothetical protein